MNDKFTFDKLPLTAELVDSANEDTRHLDAKWIVGIDHHGTLFIVSTPDIHPSFLDYSSAEEIGITPFEDIQLSPGLYRVKTKFEECMNYETGLIDDFGFVIYSWEPIKTYKVKR
jgi:hypothetical protein